MVGCAPYSWGFDCWNASWMVIHCAGGLKYGSDCGALFCVDSSVIGCTALLTGVILTACLSGGSGGSHGGGGLFTLVDIETCDVV